MRLPSSADSLSFTLFAATGTTFTKATNIAKVNEMLEMSREPLNERQQIQHFLNTVPVTDYTVYTVPAEVPRVGTGTIPGNRASTIARSYRGIVIEYNIVIVPELASGDIHEPLVDDAMG